MKIDLFHNKIVKDTVTEQFIRDVEAVLAPMINEAYPGATGILMYEDYIADGFASDGMWYYPLTVKAGESTSTAWVRWPFNKSSFATASPYSYIGEEPLGFELADSVPDAFIEAVSGRAIDYDEGAIKLNVRATAADVMLLCGHYSQTFVDEMASQITKQLTRALSIDGFGNSTIELELVFAPGTYMEHTSENVTYRRLLMVDGASRPRDFWVKWTRCGGGIAYTISDAVRAGDIVFELGEDVAHKIREKEYRFLCSTNPNTYQAAMGKKAVTEWRDLIKRAVRRGEIIRLESELEVAERAGEVHDKLTEVLSALGHTATPAKSEEPVAAADGGFDSLMDLVRAALEKSEGHTAEEAMLDMPMIELDLEEGGEPVAEDAEDISDAPVAIAVDDTVEEGSEDLDEVAGDDTEPEIEEDAPEAEETDEPEAEETDEPEAEETDEPDTPLTIEELLKRLEEAANAPVEEPEDGAEAEEDDEAPFDADEVIEELDDEVEDSFDTDLTPEDNDAVGETIDEAEATDDDAIEESENEEDEPEAADEECEQTARDEPAPVAAPAAQPVAPVIDEESIRREIEARIRLEYEAQARARAEAEIARLIAESNALKEENERLAAAARNAEAMHQQAISDHLDATERARATEDMLRAELEAKERREARERDRLAEAARIAVEEQRRREAEMEERYRIEREQREEAERLERERLERERIAEEERIRAEEEERARLAAETAALAAEPKYISKRAKIIFRRAADANIIGKIREIIEETIKQNNKQHVRIHMKAYQEDRDVVNLDVLKMPADEQELLIAIVKAIGNARIGVIKIILE